MKPSIEKAMYGGLAGTVVMTLMMYFVAPILMGMRMDIAAMLGSLMGDPMNNSMIWWMGLIAHFVLGSVVFPMIYVMMAYERLPGSAVVRGLLFGLALWLVAQVIVMPMMGGGLFSANMGGMMAAMGSLVNHAIYGAILGHFGGGAK